MASAVLRYIISIGSIEIAPCNAAMGPGAEVEEGVVML